MNKTVRNTAIGALMGAVIGYIVENTSLIWFFIGTPAKLWMPGEPIDYAGEYRWNFIVAGIVLGVLVPLVVGKSFKNR